MEMFSLLTSRIERLGRVEHFVSIVIEILLGRMAERFTVLKIVSWYVASVA